MLGGLTGRLDQTIHTLSYLHKLRKTRKKVYAIADENVGWVLDTVSCIYLSHILSLAYAYGQGRAYDRDKSRYAGENMWITAHRSCRHGFIHNWVGVESRCVHQRSQLNEICFEDAAT